MIWLILIGLVVALLGMIAMTSNKPSRYWLGIAMLLIGLILMAFQLRVP